MGQWGPVPCAMDGQSQTQCARDGRAVWLMAVMHCALMQDPLQDACTAHIRTKCVYRPPHSTMEISTSVFRVLVHPGPAVCAAPPITPGLLGHPRLTYTRDRLPSNMYRTFHSRCKRMRAATSSSCTCWFMRSSEPHSTMMTRKIDGSKVESTTASAPSCGASRARGARSCERLADAHG